MTRYFILLTISLFGFSCLTKENKIESSNSMKKINIHNIPSFFFLHKGMTYSEVEKYLATNSIKHTPLLIPTWNDPVKNSLNEFYTKPEYKHNFDVLNNYSHAKYLKIYNFKIGNIKFDEIRLFFIDNVIYRLTYFKCYYDWQKIYRTSITSNNLRYELDAIVYKRLKINELESKPLILLKDALIKKYGPPNLNNSEDSSFTSNLDKNNFNPSWGDVNNSKLQNIEINLGNQNFYNEVVNKEMNKVIVEYSMYYYLIADFTTKSLIDKIQKDKSIRKKQIEDLKKKELKNQKIREQKFLDKI
ncbi:hypothetical protein [Aquirufa aurantiipilula]|uniref:hypothetical protein n=1 Tax=Aquirufa aurantiipilula TaxID=2696561 RepID=UPI001CAA5C15|nr:hypothetical protein [Aquirufa aurantiipilula]MBZ1326850.1 hypothetical protein [Aquirufa aurantiipilula]